MFSVGVKMVFQRLRPVSNVELYMSIRFGTCKVRRLKRALDRETETFLPLAYLALQYLQVHIDKTFSLTALTEFYFLSLIDLNVKYFSHIHSFYADVPQGSNAHELILIRNMYFCDWARVSIILACNAHALSLKTCVGCDRASTSFCQWLCTGWYIEDVFTESEYELYDVSLARTTYKCTRLWRYTHTKRCRAFLALVVPDFPISMAQNVNE